MLNLTYEQKSCSNYFVNQQLSIPNTSLTYDIVNSWTRHLNAYSLGQERNPISRCITSNFHLILNIAIRQNHKFAKTTAKKKRNQR